ncbi:MAG: hypothetical protein WC379_14605 [Methanoregula sp.]
MIPEEIENWTESLVLLISHDTVFALCQKSVRQVPDLQITSADRDSGIIHARDRSAVHDITVTIKKISPGSTGITLQAVTRNPSKTTLFKGPSDSMKENEKIVKTLAAFLWEQKKTAKRYEEELTIPIPYATAFDLCRRSVQMVPDIAVLDADRKTGIIHAGKPDIFITPDPGITFTIGKITTDKTRIIITDTEPDYDRWDSHTRERHLHQTERTFAMLTGFIREPTQNPEHWEPVTGKEILHDPVAFFGQEPHLRDKPTVTEPFQKFSGTGPSDSFPYSPKRKIHPGYWFILAGIGLIFWGVFIDMSVIDGFLKGTWVMPHLHKHLLRGGIQHVTLFDLLIGPISPGIFAIGFGVYALMQPTPSVVTDTNPASPTGVLVGKGPFYRDPFEAAMCSVFVPGLGQAYNGRADLGLLFAFSAGGGLLFGLVPGILIWLYAAWEAHSTANRINREEVPIYSAQGWMTWLIIAIFIPCVILTVFLFSHYGPAVALGLNFTTIRGP